LAAGLVGFTATATLADSTIADNTAAGGNGGSGGDGLGGGLYLASGATVHVSTSAITDNVADGGAGQGGGSNGQGIGGGVYNLGSFSDLATLLAHNHASTSNDDLYG
jgi:hypothetical protein